MRIFQKKEDADKANYEAYELEKGVNPRPIADTPAQITTFPCRRCGSNHKTFIAFMSDGCSPIYGRVLNQ